MTPVIWYTCKLLCIYQNEQQSCQFNKNQPFQQPNRTEPLKTCQLETKKMESVTVPESIIDKLNPYVVS